MRAQKSKAYIYGLRVAGTKRIRYIGRSIYPDLRLRQHLTDRFGTNRKLGWISECIKKGRKVEMVVIAECPAKMVSKIEYALIRHCKKRGHVLVNSKGYLDSINRPEIPTDQLKHVTLEIAADRHVRAVAKSTGIPRQRLVSLLVHRYLDTLERKLGFASKQKEGDRK
jgi:hypothetical protein